MSSDVPRSELMAAVLRAVRKESNKAALFSQAVAERLGLAGTDVECLEVLQDEGRLTVGRLAELTGLTTGSNKPDSSAVLPTPPIGGACSSNPCPDSAPSWERSTGPSRTPSWK